MEYSNLIHLRTNINNAIATISEASPSYGERIRDTLKHVDSAYNTLGKSNIVIHRRSLKSVLNYSKISLAELDSAITKGRGIPTREILDSLNKTRKDLDEASELIRLKSTWVRQVESTKATCRIRD